MQSVSILSLFRPGSWQLGRHDARCSVMLLLFLRQCGSFAAGRRAILFWILFCAFSQRWKVTDLFHRLVYPSAAFNATSVIRAVTQERATALHGVPTMFLSILDHPDAKKIDSSRLRTGIMAGSPCPIEVMKRVQRDLNMKEVTIAYGTVRVGLDTMIL